MRMFIFAEKYINYENYKLDILENTVDFWCQLIMVMQYHLGRDLKRDITVS